jgi:hypothetical protein
MIYEVVEVLAQRPPESAPIFDAVVETFGWDPLPVRTAEETSAENMTEESAEEPTVASTEKPDLVKKLENVGPALPDTSVPRPRVRKPRPRQDSDTLNLTRTELSA